MKRAALYLASLAAIIGGMAQPAFAQSAAISTDAAGGLTCFATTLLSQYGGVRRNCTPGYTNVGGGNMATGQVAVGTTATLVVAARAARQRVTITSTSAVVFYVGNSNVTAVTGAYVAGATGASITLDTGAAVYAVGAAAVTVSYVELY